MNNDNEFRELALLLSKQLEVQKKQLTLETGKTQILVSGELEKLDEVLKQQASLVLSCDGLESRRKQLLAEMELDGLTMRQVLTQSAPQQQNNLENIISELSQVLLQLKKVNARNKKILHCRLSCINQCLSFIGLKDNPLTYDQDGHFNK